MHHSAQFTIDDVCHELHSNKLRKSSCDDGYSSLHILARAAPSRILAADMAIDDAPDVAAAATAAATEFEDPFHDDWPHWDPPASVNLNLE